MTRPAPAPQRANQWISRAATATVAGLAGIAEALGYTVTLHPAPDHHL